MTPASKASRVRRGRALPHERRDDRIRLVAIRAPLAHLERALGVEQHRGRQRAGDEPELLVGDLVRGTKLLGVCDRRGHEQEHEGAAQFSHVTSRRYSAQARCRRSGLNSSAIP